MRIDRRIRRIYDPYTCHQKSGYEFKTSLTAFRTFSMLRTKIMSASNTAHVRFALVFFPFSYFSSYSSDTGRYIASLLLRKEKKQTFTHSHLRAKECEQRMHSYFIQRVVPFMKINLGILAFIALFIHFTPATNNCHLISFSHSFLLSSRI